MVPSMDLTVQFDYMDYSVYSIEYAREKFTVAAEYLQVRQKQQIISPMFKTPKSIEVYEGYYGSGSYRFTDWFELGVYYSEAYLDVDDRDDFTKYLKEWALTTRFDINEHWIAKLEGHLMDGTAYFNIDVDNPDLSSRADLEEDWFLFAAKITYSF
jgi:hypothetical protein